MMVAATAVLADCHPRLIALKYIKSGNVSTTFSGVSSGQARHLQDNLPCVLHTRYVLKRTLKSRRRASPFSATLHRSHFMWSPRQARTRLINQVRRLSQALKAADSGNSSIANTKGMPPGRSGRVSRKTFAKALAREGGLGKVGEGELTRCVCG